MSSRKKIRGKARSKRLVNRLTRRKGRKLTPWERRLGVSIDITATWTCDRCEDTEIELVDQETNDAPDMDKLTPAGWESVIDKKLQFLVLCAVCADDFAEEEEETEVPGSSRSRWRGAAADAAAPCPSCSSWRLLWASRRAASEARASGQGAGIVVSSACAVGYHP